MTGSNNRFRALWRIDAAGLGGFAALTLLAYFAIVQPLLHKRDEAAGYQVELAAQKDHLNKLSFLHRSMRNSLTATQEAVAKWNLELQPRSAENRRLAQLTAAASTAGVEVRALQTGVLIPGRRYSQLPIHVSGAATYRASADFLRAIHESFTDTAVAGLSLGDNPADAQQAGRTLNLDVDLIWHVRPAVP